MTMREVDEERQTVVDEKRRPILKAGVAAGRAALDGAAGTEPAAPIAIAQRGRILKGAPTC